MSPAPRRLSDLQAAIVAWVYRQSGAAGEPVIWQPPPLSPTQRVGVSRSLRRLEQRDLVVRLGPTLEPTCGRTCYVELTEIGSILGKRLTSRRHVSAHWCTLKLHLSGQAKELVMPAVADGRLSTSAAARTAGVSENTIRLWMPSGRLSHESTPLGALIDPRALGEIIAARERTQRERVKSRPRKVTP